MKSELLKEYRSACLDFFEKEIENLMGFEYSARVNRENDGWNSIESGDDKELEMSEEHYNKIDFIIMIKCMKI